MSTTGAANTHHDRLADFTRDIRILKLALMALVIGSITALIAYILVRLIALVTNLAFYQQFSFADSTPANATLGYWVILVPAIGGLIIGLMARYGSERIRGHGIPEAIEAILIGRSRMSPKVAVLKPLSSAISIGTGGPFGAEGPIIMTGGTFGSLFAQLFHLSAAERKTLLVAGAAGGMSAIFAAPVAAVLLAVELLLMSGGHARLSRWRLPQPWRAWYVCHCSGPGQFSECRCTPICRQARSVLPRRSVSPLAWARSCSPRWSTASKTCFSGCQSTGCGGRRSAGWRLASGG